VCWCRLGLRFLNPSDWTLSDWGFYAANTQHAILILTYTPACLGRPCLLHVQVRGTRPHDPHEASGCSEMRLPPAHLTWLSMPTFLLRRGGAWLPQLPINSEATAWESPQWYPWISTAWGLVSLIAHDAIPTAPTCGLCAATEQGLLHIV
jgi:hypothetical protein